MTEYIVYHSPNFINMLINPDAPLILGVSVACVECDDLHDVWRCTQHVDGDWTEGECVRWRAGTGDGIRSSAVGDIFEDVCTGCMYMVESIGFADVTEQVRPQKSTRAKAVEWRN